MIRLEVRVELDPAMGFLNHLYRHQVPFATAQALNKTILDVQVQQRRELDENFGLRRRDWAHRNVKIGREDFARKNRLRAIVKIESPGGGRRSDVLGKFEEGGVKRPKGQRIALPVDVKRTGSGVVSNVYRPKALNFKPQRSGKVFGRKSNILLGDRRTFMIRAPGGKGAIFQRTGRKASKNRKGEGRRMASYVGSRRTRDMNLRLLYGFTPKARIVRRLGFEQAGLKVARAKFQENFREAFMQAIRSAK